MAKREVVLGSVVGPQGPRGVQGETGPTGPQGATGATGVKGADGATWHTGTVAPTTQGANNDWYLNTANFDVYQKVSGTWAKKGNLKGAAGVTGAKGDKGDKGDAFSIAKAYVSVAAMNAGYATDGVAQGQFVIIDTGNIEDEDNAKLYIKGVSSYTYLTDLSGAKGMTGPQGPKGDTGAKGATGATGAQGPQGPQGNAGVTPELEIRNGILYAIYNE